MFVPSLTLTSPNLDRIPAISKARHQVLLLASRLRCSEFGLLDLSDLHFVGFSPDAARLN